LDGWIFLHFGTGLASPEGEFPSVIPVPDPSTNTILVAFQNAATAKIIFSDACDIRATYVTVASVAADGRGPYSRGFRRMSIESLRAA